MTGLMGLIPDLGGAGPLPKLGPMMGLVGPITDLGAHVRPEGAHTKRERARRRAFGPPPSLGAPHFVWGGHGPVCPPLVCASGDRHRVKE